MIEPMDHRKFDAAPALKECVRRLLYTSLSLLEARFQTKIMPAMFNNFKTMCTWESRYNLVIGTTFESKASTRIGLG
ncbi:hypothetical protein H5410_010606 [Solanum commersonii]|uniref:Uncharacterized protein n=1 Tax=Solanum commersonii TaxID=4109 RepID=A0A9J6AM17_SOLCO|nr:hypothetical protein H5410_010606 [Solanum commersonii]